MKEVEVVTGGNPVRALTQALASLSLPTNQVNHIYVKHDDECPCCDGTRPMRYCTCEIVALELQ